MSIRNHLVKLQKESFQALQSEILDQRRFEERRITNYRKVYLSEVKNYQKISSKSELLKEVLGSKIIFCGDFHTLSRSQYTALKILEFLAQKNKKIIVALEMVPRVYENIANDYVEKRIHELTFLKLMNYEKVWGFPWSHYKPLFEFAQKYKTRILGVNTPDAGYQPLLSRDKSAAKAIFKTSQKFPDHVIFCLYGDLHVAEPHIPQLCKDLFQKEGLKVPAMTTVFQNSDEIYWKLVDQNLSHKVDVVKIKPRQYCVLSSTPWVKWQSYQTWVEDHSILIDDVDTKEWDLHQMPDYFHILMEYKKQIHKFLQIKPPTLEDLQVYSSHDLEVANIVNKYILKAKKRVDPIFMGMIDIEMIENKSLFLPEVPLVYLQDVSPNKVIQKASQLIAFQMSKDFCIYSPDCSRTEHFYRLALIECVGFFGAKIINPKKKAGHCRDFERFLEKIKGQKLSMREKLKSEVALWILQYLHESKNKGPMTTLTKLDQQSPRLFFLCARALGRMMGDALYMQVMQEKISIPEIRKLYSSFSKSNDCAQTFVAFFGSMIHEMDITLSKDELF